MHYPKYLLALFLAVALLPLGGCGDDDKDDSGATGPNGDAVPITVDNIAQVQVAVQQSLAGAVAKGPGTHQGGVSGSVEVALNAGKAAQASGSSITLRKRSRDLGPATANCAQPSVVEIRCTSKLGQRH